MNINIIETPVDNIYQKSVISQESAPFQRNVFYIVIMITKLGTS